MSRVRRPPAWMRSWSSLQVQVRGAPSRYLPTVVRMSRIDAPHTKHLTADT